MSTSSGIQRLICHFLLIALFIQSGTGCDPELCLTNFKTVLHRFGIIKGSNLEYCQLLTRLESCLQQMTKKCWGAFYYHSSLTFARREKKSFNCSKFSETELSKPDFPSRCYHYTESVLHPVYQYCSLFGSRHLRTLTGKFETCARSGAYPFYDGKHFTIQITHSSLSSAANAITMVTVIIKEWGNCTQQKVYEVSSDDRDLMTAFVDGSTFNGNPKRKAVEIIARNDTHVEININHIATNITVMKRGPFLGVSLLIPEDNVQEFATDVETLCRSGCSGGKLMQVKEALVKPLEFTQCHGTRLKTSIKTAANRCAEVGVRDEFFDACVFDLMTSGNDLVTSVELDAQNDIVKRYLPYNTKVNSTSTGRANLSIYHSLSYDHKFSDCIAFVPRPPSSPSSAKRLAKFWSFTTVLIHILIYILKNF